MLAEKEGDHEVGVKKGKYFLEKLESNFEQELLAVAEEKSKKIPKWILKLCVPLVFKVLRKMLEEEDVYLYKFGTFSLRSRLCALKSGNDKTERYISYVHFKPDSGLKKQMKAVPRAVALREKLKQEDLGVASGTGYISAESNTV